MKRLLFLLLFMIVGINPYLSLIQPAMALNSTNIITPLQYQGNLLICNDGDINYNVYANGIWNGTFVNNVYLGTIKPNQGMYVNETLDYSLYATYDHVRDLGDVDVVKQKFNEWWLIIVIALVILMIGVKIYKVITR